MRSAHANRADAARQRLSQRQRVLRLVPVGIVVGIVLGWAAPWQLATVVAWDAVAALFLWTTWRVILPLDARRTRALAVREDDSRASAELLLLVASVGALIGVAFDLAKANQARGGLEGLLIAAGAATVVLSWGVLHTVYTLRYAHVYYSEPVGGVDFNGDAEPNYQDFAYLGFTVGMTFQVSDTDITSRAMRRTVVKHALLAYLFGAALIAMTINILANLLNQ